MTDPARQRWWDRVVTDDSVELADGTHLLWGDRVRVISEDQDGVLVSARGKQGRVRADQLGEEPVLEIYVIDVGQGDGILIVTPEGHHVMIDGGNPRGYQPTRKNAADFVDWKFHDDYRTGDADPNDINIDVLVASHADRDHFGGLQDLIADRLADDGLDTDATTVGRFIHPGLSPRVSGTDDLGQRVDGHFVTLLDDRQSASDAIGGTDPQPQLASQWRGFISDLLNVVDHNGQPPPFERVSDRTPVLAGFDGSAGSGSEVAMTVLGPIEADVGTQTGFADLGNLGVNKNGHSVALRLDYRDRSILLAGDSNEESQRLLLDHLDQLPPAEQEAARARWRVDVAKACHHGSHHVDFDFLKLTAPLATVISSGDANTHDHPRPWVLAGSALAGRVIHDGHRLKAPLVYSTEIARSVDFETVARIDQYDQDQSWGRPAGNETGRITTAALRRSRALLETNSDEFTDNQPLRTALVASKLVYGLVNIRTDGHRLLFAIRNEADKSWQIETIEASEIATAVTYSPD